MGPFRIQALTIEGFKAFTTPQTLRIDGKHVFLFGANGRGKTSILEAIGWCIWGGEKETLLQNAFYGGDCQVELILIGPDGAWRLRRRMRLGSNRSDVSLLDSAGAPHRIEEVFPNLPKITGEGTYIVLAEQQAHGRTFVDVGHFGDMLYAYLGLSGDKRFLEETAILLDEYQKVRQSLDSEGDRLREELNNSLDAVDADLGGLLKRPPWGQSEAPTYEETIQKIRDLGTALGLVQPLPLSSPHVAMQRIAEHIQQQVSIADNRSEIDYLESKIARLEDLTSQVARSQEALAEIRDRFDQMAGELREILEGVTLEEISARVERMEVAIQKSALLAQITQSALSYIDRTATTQCPVCGDEHSDLPGRVILQIKGMEKTAHELVESLPAAKMKLQSAKALTDSVQELARTRAEVESRIEQLGLELERLLELDDSDEVTEEAVHSVVMDSNRASRTYERLCAIKSYGATTNSGRFGNSRTK